MIREISTLEFLKGHILWSVYGFTFAHPSFDPDRSSETRGTSKLRLHCYQKNTPRSEGGRNSLDSRCFVFGMGGAFFSLFLILFFLGDVAPPRPRVPIVRRGDVSQRWGKKGPPEGDATASGGIEGKAKKGKKAKKAKDAPKVWGPNGRGLRGL